MKKIQKIIGKYINGNYTVTIFEDGTKIRMNNLDELVPQFSENCDVKITDRCSQGCPFCYEGCTKEGKHSNILEQPWINSLHPFTELAINGNDLDHPDLETFLEFLKNKKVIANMTVNENQFITNYQKIKDWLDKRLVWGIGISYKTNRIIPYIKDIPNAVLHVINGIITEKDFKDLVGNNLKVLILGYKTKGRGLGYVQENGEKINNNISWLHDNLEQLIPQFKVVSFDNLAINQLKVKRLLSEDEWSKFYMGDDGQYTFYIDAVNGTFSRNSTTAETERFDIGNKTVDEMFTIIRNKEKS
jgi:hypothetical protein